MAIEDTSLVTLLFQDKSVKKIPSFVHYPEIIVIYVRVHQEKLLERLLAIVVSSVPKQIYCEFFDYILHTFF